MNEGFFTVGKLGDHWLFLTPQAQPFFSIGLNHFDATTLKYPDNAHLWTGKYGRSMSKWIQTKVVPDLKTWGFNTIGWVQEVVIRSSEIHRHSRNWTYEEYRAANMPFCPMLPFAEIHQWELETRYPNVFGQGFADWCDYVARAHCVDMAEDPNLLGYFFSDCPAWLHPTRNPQQKGAWFDPEMYQTESGRRQFAAMVDKYYQITTQAVRRYDRQHLILGDRLEAEQSLPDDLLLAAARYVDVLSFQFFAPLPQVLDRLGRIHALTGMPLLLADAATSARGAGGTEAEQGAEYQQRLDAYFDARFLLGAHYCGAYLENHVRRHGLLGRDESPRTALVSAMQEKNHDLTRRVGSLGARG